MPEEFYVYITTNKRNNVFYTGVTNNLNRRIYQHKHKLIKGFTQKYRVNKLVFLEVFKSPNDAIRAEKRIKGWTRQRKIELIKSNNPDFKDLADGIE